MLTALHVLSNARDKDRRLWAARRLGILVDLLLEGSADDGEVVVEVGGTTSPLACRYPN